MAARQLSSSPAGKHHAPFRLNTLYARGCGICWFGDTLFDLNFMTSVHPGYLSLPINLMTFCAYLATLLALLISLPLTPRLMKLFSRKRRASTSMLAMEPPASASIPRKMIVQESRLLNLPNEILDNIANFLDETGLLHARLTCSHLKELAEPLIYRAYDIRHGEDAQKFAVLTARDARRPAWVRSVLVSTRYDEDQGLVYFPHYLRLMRNVRSLILETPDCNSKSPEDRVKWVSLQKDYEAIFRQSSLAIEADARILPKLEECTMHFVDETVSLYPLTKYSSIFLHPTLKSLTLSCACTDFPSNLPKDYRQYKHKTLLEYLHLEECDFNAESLEILLKLPKALKSLKLSEGVRYTDDFGARHSRMHGDLNPGALSGALSSSISHSLETLSLSLGYKHAGRSDLNLPGRSLDLTRLGHLKHLEVSKATFSLLSSLTRCDHQHHRRLPPSLESIRVFSIPIFVIRGRHLTLFQPCLLKDKKGHGCPKLKHLIYAYEYQSPRGRAAFGLFQRASEESMMRFLNNSKDKITLIHDQRYHIYKDTGTRVTLEAEVTPPGYIPPYLHNEEKPFMETLWDSDTPTPNAIRFQNEARQRASEAANGSPAQTLGDDEDDAHEDGGTPLGFVHGLPPGTAELLEMLMMHPGQPFQL